jgi:hypothetical protein
MVLSAKLGQLAAVALWHRGHRQTRHLCSAAQVIERKATLLQLAFVWVFSWLANLCGSLWLVELMVWGEVFEGRSQFTINLARYKTSHSFGVTLVRGILCNWCEGRRAGGWGSHLEGLGPTCMMPMGLLWHTALRGERTGGEVLHC